MQSLPEGPEQQLLMLMALCVTGVGWSEPFMGAVSGDNGELWQPVSSLPSLKVLLYQQVLAFYKPAWWSFCLPRPTVT